MNRKERFKTDLTKPIRLQELKTDLFMDDETANEIIVDVFDGEIPYTLSGAVKCYMIRPDTATLTIDGTITGNAVSVILPKNAYYFTGRASFVIKVESEGNKVTVCAFTALVYRDRSDSIVDNDRIVPDLSEIMGIVNQINDMTVSARSLPAGAAPQAVLTSLNGHYNIDFSIPRGISGAEPDVQNATALAANWSSQHPFTQNISVQNITPASHIIVSLASNCTDDQYNQAALARLVCSSMANGSITLTALGIAPTTDIPITIINLSESGSNVTIDDTAGDGDYNKTWSADKLHNIDSSITDLKSALYLTNEVEGNVINLGENWTKTYNSAKTVKTNNNTFTFSGSHTGSSQFLMLSSDDGTISSSATDFDVSKLTIPLIKGRQYKLVCERLSETSIEQDVYFAARYVDDNDNVSTHLEASVSLSEFANGVKRIEKEFVALSNKYGITIHFKTFEYSGTFRIYFIENSNDYHQRLLQDLKNQINEVNYMNDYFGYNWEVDADTTYNSLGTQKRGNEFSFWGTYSGSYSYLILSDDTYTKITSLPPPLENRQIVLPQNRRLMFIVERISETGMNENNIYFSLHGEISLVSITMAEIESADNHIVTKIFDTGAETINAALLIRGRTATYSGTYKVTIKESHEKTRIIENAIVEDGNIWEE